MLELGLGLGAMGAPLPQQAGQIEIPSIRESARTSQTEAQLVVVEAQRLLERMELPGRGCPLWLLLPMIEHGKRIEWWASRVYFYGVSTLLGQQCNFSTTMLVLRTSECRLKHIEDNAEKVGVRGCRVHDIQACPYRELSLMEYGAIRVELAGAGAKAVEEGPGE